MYPIATLRDNLWALSYGKGSKIQGTQFHPKFHIHNAVNFGQEFTYGDEASYPNNMLKNIFGGSFSQAFFVASDLDGTNRARPIYTYT